jgi:hypothetical protein
MSKDNQFLVTWLTAMKNSIIAEIENPFTTIGLINAIIQDLNDIRLKIETMENYVILQNNGNKVISKEMNEKENFVND